MHDIILPNFTAIYINIYIIVANFPKVNSGTVLLINMPHPLITDVFDSTPVFHAYILCKSTFSLFV